MYGGGGASLNNSMSQHYHNASVGTIIPYGAHPASSLSNRLN